MRTMEGSRNPDFLSTGGGLGRHSRHTAAARALSPNCDTYGGGMPPRQRQRQRPRQGDSSTEEIIRFVRGYQLEREPTLMRLQKKAPLPGIGQVGLSGHCILARIRPWLPAETSSVWLTSVLDPHTLGASLSGTFLQNSARIGYATRRGTFYLRAAVHRRYSVPSERVGY